MCISCIYVGRRFIHWNSFDACQIVHSFLLLNNLKLAGMVVGKMILTVNHLLQPFPLQTTSLFGGSSGVSTSSVPMGPLGVATVPRNVNIHIHTGILYLRMRL